MDEHGLVAELIHIRAIGHIWLTIEPPWQGDVPGYGDLIIELLVGIEQGGS